MRRLLILVAIVLAAVSAVSAQPKAGRGADHEKMMKEIQEFKLKFLAQEMELRDDQREQFIETYKEMSAKRNEVMRKAWRLEHKVKKDKDATDKDYKAAADAMVNSRIEDARIEKEYDAKFEKYLTPKQMFRMKSGENKFRMKLEQMRQGDKAKDKDNQHNAKTKK